MIEFNFDIVEFIFHQPSRVNKMKIPAGRTGISGQGKHLNVLLDSVYIIIT